MNKRKKPPTSEEEGHPSNPAKSPRLENSNQDTQSNKLDPFCHPEESEDGSGYSFSAELCPSSPNVDTHVLGPLQRPEKEPDLPPSQVPVGRFVPQFARARKTVARNVEARVEVATSKHRPGRLETPPEPGAQPASTQSFGDPPELNLQETGVLGEQAQADDPCSQTLTTVPGSGDSLPEFCPKVEEGLCSLETASLHPVSKPGGNHEPPPQRPQVPSDGHQSGRLSGGDDEEEEPECGAPHDGAEADPPGVGQEAGDGIPGSPVGFIPALHPAQGLSPPPIFTNTPSMAQGLPEPGELSSQAGGEADRSCPVGCSMTETLVMGNLTLEEAGPPASPDNQAPEPDISGALWGSGGEAEREEQPLCNASALGNPEPTVHPGDPGLVILEVGPQVNRTPDPQGPEVMGALPSLAQPVRGEPAELPSQCQQHLGELHPSPQVSSLLNDPDTADGPLQETAACSGGTGTSTDRPGPPQLSLVSASQVSWPESPAMELDFLLDSQMQDALDVTDVELPPEQGFPEGTTPGLEWPGPSPCATIGDADAVMEAKLRPVGGTWVPEPSRMEDATDTVRGLIVELSNLNRLIMSTHRDLEACKRLSSRKAKAPHKAKGSGGAPLGEQGWRAL
ncbi:break repair meiotic recombinase recruitment factor 1 [Dipodomys spectabilis]|uniref:break repair meiotic recombinase recruitment factor 1 n=1 Tax=Dipodomys spectabilis TaxID=105255 RepID=UPI001C53F2D9|nr:break repair meiotic recombinase recruitment factor 1 [Dipodomys spectabilis]